MVVFNTIIKTKVNFPKNYSFWILEELHHNQVAELKMVENIFQVHHL